MRLNQAAAFCEVAELVDGEDNDLATLQVAASLAVLAGIAASDAACCTALGYRSRGQDHRQAIALVTQAGPDGPVMARALSTLLDLKDNAHCGMEFVTTTQVKRALRQAAILVDSATKLLNQE